MSNPGTKRPYPTDNPVAEIETTMGKIGVELFAQEAPQEEAGSSSPTARPRT